MAAVNDRESGVACAQASPSQFSGSRKQSYNISNHNVPAENKVCQNGENLSLHDKLIAWSAFIMCGVTSLVVWNGVLNCLASINLLFAKEINTTITASYMTVSVLVNVFWIFYGSSRLSFQVYMGALALGITSFVLPLITQFASSVDVNSGPATTGIVLLHLLVAVMGAAAGTIQPASFAIGSIMPGGYCGVVSFGCGISGIITFGLWLILSMAAYPTNTDITDSRYYNPSDVYATRTAFWIYFYILGAIAFSTFFLYYLLMKIKWASAVIRGAKPRPDEEKESFHDMHVNDDADCMGSSTLSGEATTTELKADVESVGQGEHSLQEGPSDKSTKYLGEAHELNHPGPAANSNQERPSWRDQLCNRYAACRQAWIPLLSLFCTMFLSLLMFPNVAPVKWVSSFGPNAIVICIGMFQIGDMVGRYIPNLGKYAKFLMCGSGPILIVMSVMRAAFIPLFMVTFKFTQNDSDYPVLSNLGFQCVMMLLFSITGGWLASLCMMYTPSKVSHPKDKATVSTISVLVLLLSIMLGLWVSKLFTL